MSNPNPTGFQTDNSETTVQDRGLFGFGKKEHGGDVHVPAVEAQQKPSIIGKIRRSGSSSCSSSDEEVVEHGVKVRKPKKKGLTEKIKEKLPGDHKDERVGNQVASGDYMHKTAGAHSEEKKGLTEKIKEKLPDGHKDEKVGNQVASGDYMHKTAGAHSAEKKGLTETIKEKLPGGHKDEKFGTQVASGDYMHKTAGAHPEEKNIIGHVQEKLPGNASTAPPHVGSAYQETPEKKGVLGKIKEMLPGGHKDGVEANKGRH